MYKYEILGEIGKGSFGTVFKARQTKINTDFAIKKVRCDAPENVELALQEFWTLSSLGQHENIIRFEECYLQHGEDIRRMKHGDKNSSAYLHLVEMAIKGKRGQDQAHYYLWFVMEFCDCGDMNDYILTRDPIAYLNAMFMIQLADGISFLHKSNVVHRDLKPENVLIRSANQGEPLLKIADFGLSKVCTSPIKEDVLSGQGDEHNDFNVDTCWLSSACGSDFFMAPEVFQGRYTAKADVFAMGIIFWAIMDRITFIDAGTKKVLLGTYVRREKEVLPVGEALLDDPNLNMAQLLIDTGHGPVSGQRHKRSQTRTCITGNKSKLRGLIAQMVHPNPDFRPSSQELLGKLGVILQLNKRPMSIKTEMHTKAKLVSSSRRRSRRDEKNIKIVNEMKNVEEAMPHEQNLTTCHVTRSKTNIASRADNRRASPSKRIIVKEKNDKLFPEDHSNLQTQILGKVSGGNKRRASTRKTKKRSGAVNSGKKVVTSEVTTLRRSLRQIKKKQVAGNDESDVIESGNNSSSISQTNSDVSDKISLKEEESFPAVKKGANAQKKGSIELSYKTNQQETENEFNSSSANSSDSYVKSVSGTSSVLDRRKPISTMESSGRSSVLSKYEVPVKEAAVDVRTAGNDTNSKTGFTRGGRIRKSPATNLAVLGKFEGGVAEDLVKPKQTFSPPLVGDVRDRKPTVEITGFRRRIGLKAQICECKPKPASTSDNEDEMSHDPGELLLENAAVTDPHVSIIPQDKPRFEVPCSPCVVEQSVVKGFRHNPFYAAVKKRWRYVVLEETTSDSNGKEKQNNPSAEPDEKHAVSKTDESRKNIARFHSETQKPRSVAENLDGNNNRNTSKLLKKEVNKFDKKQNTAREERIQKTRKIVDEFDKKISSKRSPILSKMEFAENISSVPVSNIVGNDFENFNKRLVSHSIGRILSPEPEKTHRVAEVSTRDTSFMIPQKQKSPNMNRLKKKYNGKISSKDTMVSQEYGYLKDTIVPKTFLPRLVNFWNPSMSMNFETLPHLPQHQMSHNRKISQHSNGLKKTSAWGKKRSNQTIQIPTIDLTKDDKEDDQVEKEYPASRKRKNVEPHHDLPPQKLRRGEAGMTHRTQLRGRPRISVTSPQARSSVIEYSPPKTRILDVTHSPLLSPHKRSFQNEHNKEIQKQYHHNLNDSSLFNEYLQSPLRSNEQYSRNIQSSSLLHSPLLSPIRASPNSYSSIDSRNMSSHILSSPDKSYLHASASTQRALRSADPHYQFLVSPSARLETRSEHPGADLDLRSHYFRNPADLQIPTMMNLLQPGNLLGGHTGSYVYKHQPVHNSSQVHDPHLHRGSDLNKIAVPCKNSLCASCVHDERLHACSQKRSAGFQTIPGQLQRALTAPLYPSLPFVSDITGISMHHYSQQQQSPGIFSKYPFIPSVQNPS